MNLRATTRSGSVGGRLLSSLWKADILSTTHELAGPLLAGTAAGEWPKQAADASGLSSSRSTKCHSRVRRYLIWVVLRSLSRNLSAQLAASAMSGAVR